MSFQARGHVPKRHGLHISCLGPPWHYNAPPGGGHSLVHNLPVFERYSSLLLVAARQRANAIGVFLPVLAFAFGQASRNLNFDVVVAVSDRDRHCYSPGTCLYRLILTFVARYW